MLSRERRSEVTKQSTTHMEQLGMKNTVDTVFFCFVSGFAPARGSSPSAGDAKSTTSSDEGAETTRYRHILIRSHHEIGFSFRYYQHQSVAATQTSAAEASAQLRTRNIVFCAILLREFIQVRSF